MSVDREMMGVAVESHVEPATQNNFGLKMRAYFALTKPRVVELLLVTTVPTMILAARGIPNLWLVLATVVGGYMSAGSAGAFNCYIDRDIDRVMHRTKDRPLVTGVLSDREALVFAWALGIASVLVLGFFTNWLAALLSVAAIFLYVVFYTLILKRRTKQNIVWGGVAGCMPVFIGWAAVTGSLDWPAVILFMIIFLWTPPHYWPLSMKYRDDYKEAGVPMLSVLRGRTAVGLQVVLYAWAMVACSLLLIPVAGMGVIYSVTAIAVGGWFLFESHRLYDLAVQGNSVSPMRVFHGSIAYLTIIFLAVAIDPLVHLL